MKPERLKELGFTSWCINNATSIYVFILIVTFAGMMVYRSLPKELFPDVVVPTISIVTIYPGATPEDIENLVTKPIEKQVKSVITHIQIQHILSAHEYRTWSLW